MRITAHLLYDGAASTGGSCPARGHVWRARASTSSIEQAWTLLTDDERERAYRFRAEADRARFVIGRASLREMLSRYLVSQPPVRVPIAKDVDGKPVLGAGGGSDIRFNVSHSGEWVVCAIAACNDIGIDIECIGRNLNYAALTSYAFSFEERYMLNRAPASARARRFFKVWTCKEAYVKAVGQGLHLPLERVNVALLPHDGPRLLLRDAPFRDEVWSARYIDVASDYVAAVVMRGNIRRVKYFDWRLQPS